MLKAGLVLLCISAGMHTFRVYRILDLYICWKKISGVLKKIYILSAQTRMATFNGCDRIVG